MPPQISRLPHYLAKRGNTKIAFFSLKCCISALLESNQSLLDVFNLFDSQYYSYAAVNDSIGLNLAINAFSSALLGGMVQEKRKSRALQQLDCVARTLHQCAVF